MLKLSATFSTPVAMGTGHAGRGLDHTIDHDSPLSAAAVKGTLRDEARWLLPADDKERDHQLVVAVFGDPRNPCPWNFSIAPDAAPTYAVRPRIRVGDGGTVVPGALAVSEEAGIRQASIEIVSRGPIPSLGVPSGLDPLTCHLAILSLAAHAVEKLGQQRTRGLGWVRLTSDRPVEADLELLWRIRRGDAS